MNELRHNRIFDPHVHFRDEEWSDKATMDAVVTEGQKVGIEYYIDMPNLPRPVIDRVRVDERIALAKKRGIYDHYHLYVGLTADPVQVVNAVDLVDQYDEVAGLKLFAGDSTGDLTVADYKKQELIYQSLADVGYKNVLAVHCEDKTITDRNINRFDRLHPETWADARPPIAESISVGMQIGTAKDTEFRGHLRILHVSYDKTIDLVRLGLNDNLDIGIELTPHHLMYSVERLRGMSVEDAMEFKCNPSIKNEVIQLGLWDFLMDLTPKDPLYYLTSIGSDYAPHESGAKISDNPPSGVAKYGLYKEFISKAKKSEFSEQKLNDLLYNNAIRTFNLDIKTI